MVAVSFAAPIALVALVLLPLAGGVLWWLERRRERDSARFANPALQPNLLPARPGWRRLFPLALMLIALAALVLRARLPAGLRDAAPAVAVGLLETTANALIAVATTVGLVSLVGVLASLYPIVTVALARVVLGERIARSQQLGAVAALAGVVMIAAGAG